MVAFATPPEWVPDTAALDWTKNLIAAVADGAIWGTSYGTYRFDKKKKILTLAKTLPGSNPEDRRRIRVCFEKLGWTVKEKT